MNLGLSGFSGTDYQAMRYFGSISAYKNPYWEYTGRLSPVNDGLTFGAGGGKIYPSGVSALNPETPVDEYKKRLPGSERLYPETPWEKAVEKYKSQMPISQLLYPKEPGEEAKEARSNGISGVQDCQTCNSRKYVDKSDDMSVSYQSPTHISPMQSRFSVMAHEMEHVFSERAKSAVDGSEVVRQSVTIKSARCPECGVIYASGGITRTVTMKQAQESYKKVQNAGRLDLNAMINIKQ